MCGVWSIHTPEHRCQIQKPYIIYKILDYFICSKIQKLCNVKQFIQGLCSCPCILYINYKRNTQSERGTTVEETETVI